ncbi:MAG: hypothetical protein ACJ751_19065 [Niastella sp.]|uniref:hypothetical protein n=1 Tax=Niastella sp. TaxID=1869183 RepID=UPI00389A4388
MNILQRTDTAIVFRTLNELPKKVFRQDLFPGVHKTPVGNYIMENTGQGGQGFHKTTNEACFATGLCNIGNYDSAFYYFDVAMQMANALNSEVWKGIISGNKGYTYFLQKKYDIAKPLFEFDYRTSKQHDSFTPTPPESHSSRSENL